MWRISRRKKVSGTFYAPTIVAGKRCFFVLSAYADRMNVATKDKTNKMLAEVLREVREVRALVEPISRAVSVAKKSAKKLPKWLQASLRDVRGGRVSGPFNTVQELMADLNDEGK